MLSLGSSLFITGTDTQFIKMSRTALKVVQSACGGKPSDEPRARVQSVV